MNMNQIRSFGPAIHVDDSGNMRPSCEPCTFRIHLTCTHCEPGRTIPDPANTPEWCAMRESMLRDVREEANAT